MTWSYPFLFLTATISSLETGLFDCGFLRFAFGLLKTRMTHAGQPNCVIAGPTRNPMK
jgi:hypothetical protein